MIQGISASLSGLRAYINQTTVTSNNIANLNTPGFKASTAVQQSMSNNMGAYTSAVQTTQGQGAMMMTMNSLDMGINGAGYFKVKGANGSVGYTRAGSFSVDSKGKLTDANGNAVQGYKLTTGANGNVTKSGPGDIDVGGSSGGFSVSSNGTVSAMVDGKSQPVAQVELYNFNNPNGLERGGANIYTETAASGQAVSGAAGSGSFGEIVPSSLEMSNVDLAEQMVGLIESSYGFAAQTKMIRATDEMMGSLLDIKT
ncbi:MAG: flagellar hook basal-body protein [Nitrospinae bacterium]|nr:flagellar hook basal-body protein [Nitrospinota bacterium]